MTGPSSNRETGIVGFAEDLAKNSNDSALDQALAQFRRAEIARLASLAIRVREEFGALVSAAFLYHEISGRLAPPDIARSYAARLARRPAAAHDIATELCRQRAPDERG